jgi:hypothetical protein
LKNGQKLKLGDAHVTPRNIQEVQASKLGDKLLVSSRPLKLEGVLCIYVLLSHEGQAENHLYVFPYDLNTHLTFIVSFS